MEQVLKQSYMLPDHLESKKQYGLKEQFFNPNKNTFQNDWTIRLNKRIKKIYEENNKINLIIK